MTRLTDERIASLARQYLGTCKRVFYTKWKDGIDIEYPTLEVEQFARAIEAELSKQEPVARPRLPRIDHFAREAFEKFASGVECELTNYRWFEAGWDARGDTVAAAPLPSAPAQSITDYMMDLVDRLGHEAENVDPKAWQHLLVYAPKPSAPDTVQVPDPKPRWFDI